MNIKFNDIFSDAIENFKTNKQKLIVNSLIFSILTAFISFVFIAITIAMLFATFSVSSNTLLQGILPIILMVVLWFIIAIPVMFIDVVGIYAVAKSAKSDESLAETLKSVVTKSNIWTYIKMVELPLFVVSILFTLMIVLAMLVNYVLFGLVVIIGVIGLIAFNYFITAPFHLAMYIDPIVKNNAKDLIKKYGRGTLFNVYIIQVGLMILISLVTGMAAVIPLVGVFISNFLTYMLGGAVVQSMIDAVNNQESGQERQNSLFVEFGNEHLKVKIAKAGAELKSLVANEKEYMWNAEPEVWGRTSPVLFPFVGKLKDDRYEYNGDIYPMSQHGFLRDRIFTVKEQLDNTVTFVYTSTLADYDLYPFDFTVEICYTIDGNKITTKYKVINNGSEEMLYQIGAHPAFNVSSVDNLQVIYPKQNVTKHYFANGLQTETKEVEVEIEQLTYESMNINIPCYSNFEQKYLTLVENGNDYLKFDFTQMEYLAIWSPEFKDAKFVCIEPWNGICSRQDQIDYKLENKEGMNTLGAKSAKECSYSIEVC